jgi:hypothetical protein
MRVRQIRQMDEANLKRVIMSRRDLTVTVLCKLQAPRYTLGLSTLAIHWGSSLHSETGQLTGYNLSFGYL